MNGLMRKAGLGIALAATALTAAAPADAQRWGRYRHYDRGGNAAAGAVLGGIVGLGIGAAIASNNRSRYYDRGYYYDAPPPPPPVYRDRGYYYDDYRPRCWTEYRRDYDGYPVPVRVCN
ncbi:hypothetical protein Q5H91_12810 [Sphingomonas sp. KR1UV-12]|uniref:Uncharacterized protein n=1 Tax=Sphingomonas aurea TaxID=3063994 RepID=A0ABT9EMQ8_9SPHN|nr:hypothetical protein [Sphingomonas sp. KR1UV-12]MDP1028096.1 hypothetical protein [Sphingomonas sp. KR1UV-12]